MKDNTKINNLIVGNIRLESTDTSMSDLIKKTINLLKNPEVRTYLEFLKQQNKTGGSMFS